MYWYIYYLSRCIKAIPGHSENICEFLIGVNSSLSSEIIQSSFDIENKSLSQKTIYSFENIKNKTNNDIIGLYSKDNNDQNMVSNFLFCQVLNQYQNSYYLKLFTCGEKVNLVDLNEFTTDSTFRFVYI